jgi:Flp pilus assembly pilin Flp
MEKIYTMMATFFAGMYERDESEDVGAGLVEYALLVFLVSIASIVILGTLGVSISDIFDQVNEALTGG